MASGCWCHWHSSVLKASLLPSNPLDWFSPLHPSIPINPPCCSPSCATHHAIKVTPSYPLLPPPALPPSFSPPSYPRQSTDAVSQQRGRKKGGRQGVAEALPPPPPTAAAALGGGGLQLSFLLPLTASPLHYQISLIFPFFPSPAAVD